ncbi:MAG: hypothetical protein WDN26_19215 [Chitinophagaceae bacterium]
MGFIVMISRYFFDSISKVNKDGLRLENYWVNGNCFNGSKGEEWGQCNWS